MRDTLFFAALILLAFCIAMVWRFTEWCRRQIRSLQRGQDAHTTRHQMTERRLASVERKTEGRKGW